MSDDRSRLSDLQFERKQWEKLIESPEWGKLVAILQTQADALQQEILFSPLAGHDAVFTQEFRKGQLEGRLSITNTVETVLGEIQAEIDGLTRKDDDGTRT
jgi:hypothetical protein